MSPSLPVPKVGNGARVVSEEDVRLRFCEGGGGLRLVNIGGHVPQRVPVGHLRFVVGDLLGGRGAGRHLAPRALPVLGDLSAGLPSGGHVLVLLVRWHLLDFHDCGVAGVQERLVETATRGITLFLEKKKDERGSKLANFTNG